MKRKGDGFTNRTDSFIKDIEGIKQRAIPESVILRTKLALLDYIGVTIAGLKEHRQKVDSLIADFCDEGGKILPVGVDRPMSMNNAVFLNGLNGHALDFDDGTNAGIIHLGSPIFSVLLPLAQKHHFDGETLLRAAIIGYEASFTMARSIQPTLKKRGYHATATCGLLGIAMAVSEALGFSEKETKDAFSTAAVSATGTLKVLEDGSQLKPFNVGKTALLGLIATQMARAGFETPDDVLSGTAGYLCQLYGTDELEFVSPILDGTYAIEKAYIKPYAACRYTHPSIDIAKELRKERIPDATEVDYVKIKTYSLAVNKHDHTDIPGSASAKMSIPYNFAVTYMLGKTGMEAFTSDALNNPQVQNLTKKITVEEDAEMTAAFPQKTIATAEVVLKDGTVLKGESVLPKGEPENPLSLDEVIEKFSALATYGGKSQDEITSIVDAVLHLEDNLDSLHSLI